jgi:predicted PilT family ATPase
VEAAEAWFKKTLKHIELENFEMEVAIFRRYHSEIIGKGGVNIRKIRDATGVRIDVPSADENSDIITVTGVKANCEKAAEMMLTMQADIANIVTESLMVPQQYVGVLPCVRPGTGDWERAKERSSRKGCKRPQRAPC